jgi:hypothetical protein
MSIVSSTYMVDEHTQRDGRRYVLEEHIDSEGVVYRNMYLSDVGANYSAILAIHASKLAIALAEQEAEEVLNG